MSTVFSNTQISIGAGATVSLRLAFNGNTQQGGDYHGPVVGDALPTRIQQSLRVSTFSSMRIRVDPNGLTSRTVYLFRVTNPNTFHVVFNMEFFFD